MLTGEIKAAVREIRRVGTSTPQRHRDSEKAHALEDELRERFIEYISRHPDPLLAAKAKLVLSTKAIEFNRWCA